jgi:deazaflavin-dependent oxidoreductase (nitroreductase family)
MFIQGLQSIETAFYRGVNLFIEPLVRAGIGSPGLWPTGAIVIETIGRKSERKYNVPLLAARIGDLLVVSTIRRRSQWLQNVAANPKLRYWLNGQPHEARAIIVSADRPAPTDDDVPPFTSCLMAALQSQSRLFGASFAVLIPLSSIPS